MNALQRSQAAAKSKRSLGIRLPAPASEQAAKDEQSEFPAASKRLTAALTAEEVNGIEPVAAEDAANFGIKPLANLDNHDPGTNDTAVAVLGSTEYNRQVVEQQRLIAEAHLRDPQRIADAISGKLDLNLTCEGCGKSGPEAGMIVARAKGSPSRTAGGIGPWHPDCATKHGAKPYAGRGYTDGHHNAEARRSIIELDAQMATLNKETDDMTKTKTATKTVPSDLRDHLQDLAAGRKTAGPAEYDKNEKAAATVAERVEKVKAAKAPKAEKGMSLSTQARLAFVNDSVGKLTVSDVRKGVGDSWDRQVRDSLRRLAAAGEIATEKPEGGKEVFFALATTEAPSLVETASPEDA